MGATLFDRTAARAMVGRISFFVNAGVRFVTELCKMRSFTRLWDQILLERYGVQDKKARRFRYGVQVNSLGLTEQQPENNVYRILIEALAVTLSKDARCRALQLPAWNEALGLPRPFDQQWSLRLQQVLAYETDLLEYEDLFDGSHVVEVRRAAGALDPGLVSLRRHLALTGPRPDVAPDAPWVWDLEHEVYARPAEGGLTDRPAEPADMIDEWAACGIETAEDIKRRFVDPFYFGCEADDPMTTVAFDKRLGLPYTIRTLSAHQPR